MDCVHCTQPIVSTRGSSTYGLAKHQAKLLQPFIGNNNAYIHDSTHFVQKLRHCKVDPWSGLVNFDFKSLFTRVPVDDVMSLIEINYFHQK